VGVSRQSKRKKTKRAGGSKPRPIPHVLLMVESSGAHGRGIIEGIGRYAIENGPWSIQYEHRTLESIPPEWLKEWRGDGIISRTTNQKQAKMLRATKLPLVELFGDPKISPIQIAGDAELEGEMAAEHFIGHGVRNFGYFSYGESWWVRWYREGYEKSLHHRGFECLAYRAAGHDRNVPTWNESQLPAVIAWLRSLPRPIGIYTPGDLHAMRLLDICRDLKVAVPEEVAILGRSNDMMICEMLRPTLSSLDSDARSVGYAAGELLDRMMRGEKKPEGLILIPPSHVVTRQSTDLMVIEDEDVVQAMQYIRDYACSGIDVPRVAEEVGLSRRVLERRFHQFLGRSPKEEIMRIRMETAKMLLAQTDKSRENIARRCGFASPTYFSMAFHRIVGMKPQAYRKMRRVSRD
jgi:LacI family transcriptional regulator